MTAQELNLSRRSINFFDPKKDVDMELVKRIIEEAQYAPSSMNLQPWRLILVKSDENKQKLYELAHKQQKILDAPLTLIVVGDFAGYHKDNPAWKERLESGGEEQVEKIIDRMKTNFKKNPQAKHRFTYLNTGLYAMNLMTLFKAYGMDTHPIGGVQYDEAKEAFNLSESEAIVMLISVGYHDDKYDLIKRKYRKSYKEVVTQI